MKKVLLALFLMFGFVSANVSTTNFQFEITDENGQKQSTTSNNLLNITSGSVGQYYNIKATNLSSNAAEISVKNTSGSNILLRFNASVESKSQIIYQVSNGSGSGNGQKSFTTDYYALSSCQVDKSPTNRPTRSFFIMNQSDTKYLKFSLRDCNTGQINGNGSLNLDTKLLVLETQMSSSSFDPKVQNGSVPVYGLPTVIIGEKGRSIDLPTKSATSTDLCMVSNNIESIELYDGSNKKIDSFTHTYNYQAAQGSKISFTIENKPGTNYRKMHLKLTCGNKGQNVTTDREERLYYFDARPKAIKVSGLPNNEWLYAEQKYKSDGTAYNDGFSDAIKKQKDPLTNCDNCKVIENNLESKTMKAITLTPVDANNKPIADYSFIGEIAIIGKIYGDGNDAISSSSDANIINETKNLRYLIRPCVAGSRAGCEIALAEINGATKSEIYTDIVNKTKVLAYNNVGPTVLYGVDTEWTKYSQNYTANTSDSTKNKVSTLCVNGESHSYEKAVRINGKYYYLVGCNIPFVNEKGGDELNFYSFKPAVYKLLFDSKNSPNNASYGTDKLTYIHTIEPKDYDATKNEIFEAADFKASILAIGASLESLKNNRALSHYDNHLKVANKLILSGNPANPTIIINNSKANDIAADFSVTAKNNTDTSGAIMLTLEPKNPYNHESGYKTSHVSKEITTNKENITINMPKGNFYAGKNTKDNKLNFKREDLLARSYVNIGKTSVNIDISDTNNAALNTKITNEKAAFIFSYPGEDLHFVDAAIIAPNVASNGNTADGAVYLAGYCDPASHAACKASGIFISNAIAGHMNYFGFEVLAYGNQTDIKDSTTDSLFEYEGANFSQFKRGADFLSSFAAKEVKIKLKGDKAREYCKIFRNCYALESSKFGTAFNSYKARTTQWHGDGEQQGNTIVNSGARRKEQRLNF